jgi:hypothetical protein
MLDKSKTKFKILLLSFIILIIYVFVLNFIDLPIRVDGRIQAIIIALIAVILYALLVRIKKQVKF